MVAYFPYDCYTIFPRIQNSKIFILHRKLISTKKILQNTFINLQLQPRFVARLIDIGIHQKSLITCHNIFMINRNGSHIFYRSSYVSHVVLTHQGFLVDYCHITI